MQVEAINQRLVKFVWAALIFFAWSVIQGAIQDLVPGVHALTQAGPGGMISGVHTHVGLLGWISLALMAVIYYVVPNISGKTIVWPRLIEWIFWVFVISALAGSILLLIGGVVAGSAFLTGMTGPQLQAVVMTYVMPAGILCTITAIAALMFIIQILASLSRRS